MMLMRILFRGILFINGVLLGRFCVRGEKGRGRVGVCFGIFRFEGIVLLFVGIFIGGDDFVGGWVCLFVINWWIKLVNFCWDIIFGDNKLGFGLFN